MKIFLILTAISTLAFALLPHLAYGVMRLLAWKFHWNVTYRPYGLTALVLAVLWLGTCLYGHFFGRFHYEVTHWEYASERVPQSFDGYRIVHISDIHAGSWEGNADRFQKIVDEVNRQKPDLICFTGDLCDRQPLDYLFLRPALQQLKAKDGVIAVLGNHDYSPYSTKFEDLRLRAARQVTEFERDSLGWTVLNNENCTLHRGTDSIFVMGCENHSVGIHKTIQRGDLKRAMKGTEGTFRILLTHDPAHWEAEVGGKEDIPITLSGHTHGMQLRIFGISPLEILSTPCDGLESKGEQQIYVNIGLGGSFQMRVGAGPEITVLTLKHSKP